MSAKYVSPNTIIWNRLVKNIPAVIGLAIIFLATVVSLLCFVIIPDSTPDANEMHLVTGTLKPGTDVMMLHVPVVTNIQQTSLISRVFSGSPAEFKKIPVDTVWIDKDMVYYIEYSGNDILKNPPESLKLGYIISGRHDFTSDNNLFSWNDKNGHVVKMNATDMSALLFSERLKKKTYYLGSDRFGRDMLSRILAGTRVSMSVGLIAVFISLIIGIILGALAGFFRGRTDDVIMWLINVIWSIPTLLLVIAITMALGKGFSQVFIAVGLTMWVEVARVVRGQIFSLREMEFVEAAKALGFSNLRIITKHVLPNVISPVIVIAAANFASAILLEAGLSFLGMGAQPPTPSWGMMIKENYGYIIVDAAYLAVYPGLAIMIMVLAFTWLGNGLRDAIDSKEGMGSRV